MLFWILLPDLFWFLLICGLVALHLSRSTLTLSQGLDYHPSSCWNHCSFSARSVVSYSRCIDLCALVSTIILPLLEESINSHFHPFYLSSAIWALFLVSGVMCCTGRDVVSHVHRGFFYFCESRLGESEGKLYFLLTTTPCCILIKTIYKLNESDVFKFKCSTTEFLIRWQSTSQVSPPLQLLGSTYLV